MLACWTSTYKGKSYRLDLDFYRGISPINVEGKAYVMLLLRRLQKDMEGTEAP